LEDLDPVSQDMLIGHAGELEKFQWFVRAHLESAGGELSNDGASTEKSAARTAKKKAPAK
jgi:starvation-inducible DNA-binding protein